jgi:hypothetical protein
MTQTLTDGDSITSVVFTVSTASSAEARLWRAEDRRVLAWGEVCSDLLDPRGAPVGGAKDGLCFSPAIFTGTRRMAAEVAGISLLVGDIDCGLDIGDIVPLLRASGYAWAVGSTHGHMKREFVARFPPETWTRLLEAFGSAEGVALAWARMHFVPAALAGGIERVAVSPAADGKAVVVEMVLAHPVPRWRVVVPLAAPWLPPGGPGRAAGLVWSHAYKLAWAGLGLDGLIDPSCADPPRLYFTGRQPALAGVVMAGGLVVKAEFYCVKAGAPLVPLGALVGAPPRLGVAGAVEAMVGGREAYAAARGESGHAGKRRGLPGSGGKRSYVPWMVNLEQWHHENGVELMLARLIEEREPGMLDGRSDSDSGAVHIDCPGKDFHSSGARGGTFVRDGSGWKAPGASGRARGWLHCNHAACSGTTQGRWLGALLECGAIGWDDLDAAAARVGEKRGRMAMADLGGGDGVVPPLGSRASRDVPGANGGTGAAPASADQAAPPGSGAEGMPGDRPGVASCPIPPADDSAIVQAIRLGREAASAGGDEEGAATAEFQFQGTQRLVFETTGGQFYDLQAMGARAAVPVQKMAAFSILVSGYGFPAGAGTLDRFVRWSGIRRKAGLTPCVVDGIGYRPGGGLLVQGEPDGLLYNMWRPGPPPWVVAVGDDDPVIVDLLALATAVSGNDRERDALLWWAGDMLVRPGEERATWGPLIFGAQGAGKSLFFDILCALVGDHNAAVVPFKAFMRGSENTVLMKQLLVIEEAGIALRRGQSMGVEFYDTIKTYYTARRLRLSQKYQTGQDIDLHVRIGATATDSQGFSVPPDDRRLFMMEARDGRMEADLAARLHQGITDPTVTRKWCRWLRDKYERFTIEHGFSPFRCPSDDVPSEVKRQAIEATMPPHAHVAAEIARAWGEEGRTVAALEEVVRAVAARMQMGPGERPVLPHVQQGLAVAEWVFVRRGRVGGRGAPNWRWYALSAEVERYGSVQFTLAEIARRINLERKNAEE